jgi:phosphatidylinositol alpha-mannosyltransferase
MKAKIGLVCPYNIGRGGGVQEGVLAAQAELSRHGHEVHIITPRSKEAAEKNLKNTILVGKGTDVRSPLATTAQISASFNPEELQRILDEHRFDILHFHEPWVPVLSRQLLERSKAINIATFHARMPDGAMTRTIERVVRPYTKTILKYFDSLTAVSDAAAQYVRTLTDQPVEIIPNGIDLKKYHQRHKLKPVAGKAKTILYIGRLERRKGVKHLVDAFARLNDGHVKLLLAGDGPDRTKLEFYVSEKGLKNVKFLGYISETKKLKLLRSADIFCSPALYGESFGIVLLEAMASGTPVVAGDNPGYTSVMQGRGLMSLADPTDTEAFAQRIALLLYDKDLAKLWRKWADGYVKQFDYPQVIAQYEALYKKLLKAKK